MEANFLLVTNLSVHYTVIKAAMLSVYSSKYNTFFDTNTNVMYLTETWQRPYVLNNVVPLRNDYTGQPCPSVEEG